LFKKTLLFVVLALLLFSDSNAQNKSPGKFFGRNTFGYGWAGVGTASDNTVDINFYGVNVAVHQTSDKRIKRLLGVEASASKYNFKGLDSLKFNGSGEGQIFSVGPSWERWKSTSNSLNKTWFSAGGVFTSRKMDSKIKVNSQSLVQHEVEQDTRIYAKLRFDKHRDQMHFSRITGEIFYQLQVQGSGERSVNSVKSSYTPVDNSNFGLSLEVGFLSFSEIIGRNTALTLSLGAGYNKYIHQDINNGKVSAVASFYNYWSDIIRVVYEVVFNVKKTDGKPLKTIFLGVDLLNTLKGAL
jgi:hypothetical protein